MSAPVQPSVLWREGMFLFPQHLQAFARELSSRLQVAATLGLIGDHGLLELAIDEKALSEGVMHVERARLVLRDGTLAAFPANGVVERREFMEHFSGTELDVWLGVAAAQPGVSQIGAEGDRRRRYRVLRSEVTDENDRDARRELEYRELQGHLFFGGEDRTGFDTVRIARLVRGATAKSKVGLSSSFVPTVLCCGASTVLARELGALADKARSQSLDLAARMPDIARLSSAERGSDIQGLFKLQAVNQAVGLLEPIAMQGELHPFQAYQALVQAVGCLAVFGPGRVVPALPPYDHEDLNTVFGAVIEAIDGLLVAEVAAPYDATRFEPDAVRPGLFRCSVPDEWTDRKALFHLAVEMADDADAVAEMVAAGVKLLPEQDIERVLQGVMPGIELHHERIPPLSFPKRGTLHYFAVETEGVGRESWLRILKSRSAVILSALGTPDEVSFQFYVEFPD